MSTATHSSELIAFYPAVQILLLGWSLYLSVVSFMNITLFQKYKSDISIQRNFDTWKSCWFWEFMYILPIKQKINKLLTNYNGSLSSNVYINSGTSAGVSLVFPENYPTDFSQTFAILFTLPLSRFVSISQTCCRFSLATKCEWPKFACFGSFWGLFRYIFFLSLQKQLRKAHHWGSATSCITYQLRSLSVCNRTITTVGHSICPFSKRNFKHWSSPFPLFPTDKHTDLQCAS